MYKKTVTLLSYKLFHTRFFGDSWEHIYHLKVLTVRSFFWGHLTFGKTETVRQVVSMFHDLGSVHLQWDNFIKNKTNLK